MQTKNIPDPEILIRTGNTMRLSNFLLWQLAYSEIFFEKKLWPDFNEKDYYISRGTDGINFRAKNIESFDNLEENAIDFYASVKSLYLQDRKQKVVNSNQIINTQDDSDWDDLQSN